MFNGMMDPEFMRLAQEQMSRMRPEELAKIQQQVMSNPDLVRMATESMKNLRPEDMRHAAEQLKHVKSEDMAEISEKMAKAKPEEIAAMKARADAQISYELNAAEMLKKQGNELHNHGQFHDAATKYILAKNNLKGIPGSNCRTLRLQCSLNLMSCYLKTKQFEECIKEGSEVLSYDSNNVKALYRRGQAYKELGNLQAAVSDLNNAHRASPDDDTIANVLRDAEEKMLKNGSQNGHRGVVIEEIEEEEENYSTQSVSQSYSSTKYSATHQVETDGCSQKAYGSESGVPSANPDYLQSTQDSPEAFRAFQNGLFNANPYSLAASGVEGMSPDMIKTAMDMMGKMKPEELQQMFQVASPFNGKNGKNPGNDDNVPNHGSKFPKISPEMAKMASDTMSKMSPEEFQRMLNVASLNANGTPFIHPKTDGNGRFDAGSPSTSNNDYREHNFAENSRMSQTLSNFPASAADLQENMRTSMKDPAMQELFASMMKNMSPEMMANMSEQAGMKLSEEEVAKMQQTMSSLSPDDLDRMMRWAEKAQRVLETTKKTKNWLLGRPGLIMAICMLILAFILRQLGFIGG